MTLFNVFGGFNRRKATLVINNQNARYYEKGGRQELDIASLSTDILIKMIHFNMAAKYADLQEISADPQKSLD